MPEPKHQCGTCVFFQNAQLGGNGWCTHPARQPVSDVKILVRERELACRNAWGDDLWTNESSPATTSPVPEAPRRPFSYLATHLDDEVTSVTDASIHAAPKSDSDDVVTVTSVRRDSAVVRRPAHDVNVPAVADQAERARMMARGNKAAIRSARERHVQRRTGSGSVIPEQDSELLEDVIMVDSTANPTVVAAQPVDASNQSASESIDQSPPTPPTIAIDHLDSDVGLPRLRSFLRGTSEESASANTQQSQSGSSQFEHVFRQAERIKEQSRATRQALTPAPLPVVETEEVLPSHHDVNSADGKRGNLIWDVDPASLDVAFSQARIAVNRNVRPAVVEDTVSTSAEDVLDDVLVTDSKPLHLKNDVVVDGSETELNESDDHTDDYDVSSGYVEDNFDIEAEAANGAEDHHISGPGNEEWIDNSPGSSWWRSLNFGLSRRFRAHTPMQAATDGEYESSFDHPVDYGYAPNASSDVWISDDVEHQVPTYLVAEESPVKHEVWDADAEDASDRWVHDAETLDEYEFDAPTVNQYITSEENWMLDEREFPAPQPSDWHTTRAELLASLPPVESLDDAVEWIAATPQSTPNEPLPPVRPRPDPRDFIDIFEPGGMDAFRSAVFGKASRPVDHFMPIESVSTENDEWPPAPPRHSRKPGIQSTSSAMLAGDRTTRPTDVRPVRQQSSLSRKVRSEDVRTQERSVDRIEPRESRDRSVRAERLSRPMAPPVERRDLAELPVLREDGGSDKRCLTCRSYDPSNERGRGRCTNEWSTTNRAIVEADELACHSSLGDWWIAADATWIPPESLIRPQTPRTEDLLNRLDDQQSKRGPVQNPKRVRTRNVG